MNAADRFVRVPSILMDALLPLRLSGTQWRIVLWTIRNTHGWHRRTVAYSWYRIARDLSADRGGVVRAGKQLLQMRRLVTRNGRLGLGEESGSHAAWTRWGADTRHRSRQVDIADSRHRKRGPASALHRLTKERGKDRKKGNPQGERAAEATSGHHPAGAARPVSGKYDEL